MISKELFGTTKEGKNVDLYRLTNSKGNYVEVISYGCRIRAICIKDVNQELQNVCLGYDKVADYERDTCFIGAAIGRCGNRIAGAEFELNGKVFSITKNEKGNHLHGGKKHFGNQLWKIYTNEDKLICRKRFDDGEEGYPGNVDVEITYEWTEENRLIIQYEAMSTDDTLVNLTNHTYFNLSGNVKNTILDHQIKIIADYYTPVDEYQIPFGIISDVKNTPFDFKEFRKIGDCMDLNDEQLRIGKGYDINYAFESASMKEMAVLQCKDTGIQMTCYSDQPGIQLYTGNNLDDCTENNSGFERYTALCLETQNYPDAIHHDKFPSPILRRGDVYQTTTIYAFEIV